MAAAAVAVDAVPATQGGSATAAAVGVATASALAGVCIAAAPATATVPGLLAYCATFAFYLAAFARGVWPDRVDAVLAPLGAYVRRKATLARADLESDLRLLRAHPVTAPVCAGAEGCARRARAAVAGWAAGARRKVEAKWSEHEDAAGAARCVLRLAGRLVRLAATALLDAACEQAKTKAPSVLGHLRGVIRGIRSSPTSSWKEGEEAEEEEVVAYVDGGLVFRDVVFLVWIAFYLLFTIRLFKRSINNVTGMQLFGACLAATCGLAVLLADWIHPPDDDDSDEANDAGDDAADTATPEEAKLEVRGSWQFMWVLIFIAFCADAFLLHVTFGLQPVALALLAVCNLKVLNLGKEVQLAPPDDDDDDGEGAEGTSAGVDGDVDRWSRGAMTVFAASSVKVLVIYLVLDFFMAALSFLWVCVMADLLLAEEESLLELLDVLGDDEDTKENSDSGESISGAAEEGAADEARAALHSDMSSSEDEEEDHTLQEHCDSSEVQSNTTSSEDEDEEEDAPEKQHCDDSSEEHDEHLKEQREEEPDCSGGSSSMDDGWDLVEVDPEMPVVKDETGVKRNSSRLFPWK